MKIFEWLGLETRSETELVEKAHTFAMRRTGGDTSWMNAMGVFEEFNAQDVHTKAVQDGTVTELFPKTTEIPIHVAAPTPEHPHQQSHVRVILTDIVEVTPVTFFDQDQEVI